MARLVDLSLEYKYQTAQAVLFTDGTTDAWFPKSLTEVGYDFDDLVQGKVYEVTVPENMAKEKGLL